MGSNKGMRRGEARRGVAKKHRARERTGCADTRAFALNHSAGDGIVETRVLFVDAARGSIRRPRLWAAGVDLARRIIAAGLKYVSNSAVDVVDELGAGRGAVLCGRKAE